MACGAPAGASSRLSGQPRFFHPGAVLHLIRRGNNYRWSSHRANACGDDDLVVSPHPLDLALAPSTQERREVYRRSFGLPLEDGTVEAIRIATQFQWALGGAEFCARTEALTGRRPGRLAMGRPRVVSQAKSRV